MTRSDAELAAGCARGEAWAFEAVALRFAPRLYRWAFARTGDPEDALDVAQETLLRFMQTARSFGGRCALSTWLYRISHNLTVSRLERRARERRALAQSARLEASPPPEAAEALRLVQGLEEDLRSVVTLYYVEGLALQEISAVLDLPVSTLKWRLFEGRRQIRARLKERAAEELAP